MTSAQTEKASSRLRRAGRARAASTARRAAAYTVLGLLCFLCLFFFYILLINATRTHFEIQRGFSLLPGRSLLTNLKSVLANANIPVLSGIRNSLLVSALSALLSVYFSALTAYGIHAYDFKFKKLAFTFILLIMMMPTQVSALGFVRLITKMGMADTLAPLFLPSIAAPVVFYFMLQYMEGNLPMEIVEAARIDGSGEFSTFNRIVLPILKPALAVQAIFTFVNTWNNYFTPALVLSSSGKKTLPILIAQLRSADFLKFDMGQVYMMVAIAILPVIAVYLCLSKFIVRGVALGGVKGRAENACVYSTKGGAAASGNGCGGVFFIFVPAQCISAAAPGTLSQDACAGGRGAPLPRRPAQRKKGANEDDFDKKGAGPAEGPAE